MKKIIGYIIAAPIIIPALLVVLVLMWPLPTTLLLFWWLFDEEEIGVALGVVCGVGLVIANLVTIAHIIG